MTRQEQDTTGLRVLQEANREGDDVIRFLLQHTVHRVLEEEITAFLDTATYEKTERRKDYRNGYMPRTLKTRVGHIELMVPNDREGRYHHVAYKLINHITLNNFWQYFSN